MGQKVNPLAFRLGSYASHKSNWFAGKKADYAMQIQEDVKIRQYINKKLASAGISDIVIERKSKILEVTLFTARPGVVVGRQGNGIESLKSGIMSLFVNSHTDYELVLNINEIKKPDADAALVAENICQQLQRRVAYRRAVKRALQSAMRHQVKGIKIQVSGRLNGAEIARSEWSKEGSIPLHTLRMDIDYAECTALTTYGILGVKVWINKGESSLGADASNQNAEN